MEKLILITVLLLIMVIFVQWDMYRGHFKRKITMEDLELALMDKRLQRKARFNIFKKLRLWKKK